METGEPQLTTQLIRIEPQNDVLSAVELTTQRHVEVESIAVRVGPKRTFPDGGRQEAEDLQKLYADLRRQLSWPRIERLSGRSLGTWDTEEQAVLVLRKDGKFESFGYSRNGKLYLESFEALFLLELGRLQLEYNNITMSVEHAYLLLLGETTTPKYNEYLVYSSLSRVGFILVKYQNQRYTKRTATQVDCAWALLLNAVQQIPLPNYIKKSQSYPKVRESMQQVKTRIMQQQPHEIEAPHDDTNDTSKSINFEQKIKLGIKRKAAEEMKNTVAAKKTVPTLNTSFVDILQSTREYELFQQIFEKFDIVKMQSPPQPPAENDYFDFYVANHLRTLDIAFDLYLHNDGFKKSMPKAPTFRLILLAPNEPFPTHTEIAYCHRQQKHAVPLLVLSISDSKQIQAFLYYFT